MNEKQTGAIIIEGHVQGLSNVRSLGEKGIPVIVIDKVNCIARYSKYCNKFFKCPDFNSEEFTPFLINLCKSENLKGWVLIPSNDHAVRNISVNKSHLSKYYKIITDDYSVISKIYNKKELLNIAELLNVPFPKTYYPHDTIINDFTLDFPVIIKGIEGLTFARALHAKALFCRSKEDLVETLKTVVDKISLDKLFIQEIIERKENSHVCSFTAFSVKGEIKTFWIGHKLREHPPKFGTATFSESIEVNDTLQYSKNLLKELNYTGVSEIEFILDQSDSTYKLIEINARTWLWVGLAKACGIDFAAYIYNYLNKIPVVYPNDYKYGVKWRNSVTDSIYAIKSILNGDLSITSFYKSLAGHKISAVYSRSDRLPGIMFLLMLLYIAKKRL